MSRTVNPVKAYISTLAPEAMALIDFKALAQCNNEMMKAETIVKLLRPKEKDGKKYDATGRENKFVGDYECVTAPDWTVRNNGVKNQMALAEFLRDAVVGIPARQPVADDSETPQETPQQRMERLSSSPHGMAKLAKELLATLQKTQEGREALAEVESQA